MAKLLMFLILNGCTTVVIIHIGPDSGIDSGSQEPDLGVENDAGSAPTDSGTPPIDASETTDATTSEDHDSRDAGDPIDASSPVDSTMADTSTPIEIDSGVCHTECSDGDDGRGGVLVHFGYWRLSDGGRCDDLYAVDNCGATRCDNLSGCMGPCTGWTCTDGG